MECTASLAAGGSCLEGRKVFTVLVADLVGFTSRSEAMDVEDVRGTVQPYHELLRRELERFGGTVEKFIGDAVMAVFGAPATHEDDPERAVRAALAVRDAIAEAGHGLHVRVGVNTGEALVDVGAHGLSGEGMVSGDVVNTAARLQGAAPVDGVLVGDTTYRMTGRQIEFQPHEPVEAKGKREPVPCWVAIEPRSLAPSPLRTAIPLVGRDGERDALLAVLRRGGPAGSAPPRAGGGGPRGGQNRRRPEAGRLSPVEA